MLFRTFSQRLEDIDTFQCSFNSFPHWPYISGCVQNWQNYILIYRCSPRGGGPLVISHKCRLICWLILAPRPPMYFLHKSFPGTTDDTSHCGKFHGSICLISWLPKTDLCETTGCNPPLAGRRSWKYVPNLSHSYGPFDDLLFEIGEQWYIKM